MMKKNTFLVLLLTLALVLCGCGGEKEADYRMIQVLEVSGSVSVERQTMGTIEPYEGMRLESGDKITVGADSWLKMKMDEDKYALVEPNSVLRLEASGNSTDSRTVLHLDAGAVSNRLEETLSDASSYEVNTPNSTMAVRGTVFRVEVLVNEEGVSVSNVSVYGGSVASRLVYPDGTVDGELAAVLILDGREAQIWGNDILSKYVTTENKVSLEELRLKTLEFLEEALTAGQELEIAPEELEALMAALEQAPAEEPGEPEETTAPTEETTAPTEETTEPTEETTAPTTAPTTARPTSPPAEPEAPPAEAPPADTPPATEAPTEAPSQPTNPPAYTVIFQYQGKDFAVQTVTYGGTAERPTLQPSPSGSWNFDFSQTIAENIIITWSAS